MDNQVKKKPKHSARKRCTDISTPINNRLSQDRSTKRNTKRNGVEDKSEYKIVDAIAHHQCSYGPTYKLEHGKPSEETEGSEQRNQALQVLVCTTVQSHVRFRIHLKEARGVRTRRTREVILHGVLHTDDILQVEEEAFNPFVAKSPKIKKFAWFYKSG
jgi:hypothetical protein